MNTEPQKFFIGVVDFFAILMPGALVTYVLLGIPGIAHHLGTMPVRFTTEWWVVVAFCSYLIGHLLYQIGAWVVDEMDKWLRGHERGLLISDKYQTGLQAILALQAASMTERSHRDVVNAYQWCRDRITLEHPEAMTLVRQYEADSKFFRSLFVGLIGIFVLGVFQGWMTVDLIILAVGAVFAFVRYVNQRSKSMIQAFSLILTARSMNAQDR